jgi:hypothetical protein
MAMPLGHFDCGKIAGWWNRRRIDSRPKMSSDSIARIKEVQNDNWLLKSFPISEFRKLASFISETHISTLRSLKRIDGILVEQIVDSSIDAQDYQRNCLNDESGYFKGIMALLLSIALISVGWWHVRFNDGSLTRGLIGGLITLLGWLPLWYALSILARHES